MSEFVILNGLFNNLYTNPKIEKNLEQTVQTAHHQMEEKHYERVLLDHGIGKERIRKYGFAFRGKEILIG